MGLGKEGEGRGVFYKKINGKLMDDNEREREREKKKERRGCEEEVKKTPGSSFLSFFFFFEKRELGAEWMTWSSFEGFYFSSWNIKVSY